MFPLRLYNLREFYQIYSLAPSGITLVFDRPKKIRKIYPRIERKIKSKTKISFKRRK